ncbi:phosphohistidine phosphatase [Agromyces terreus]|uniref:Phosphohistidine phosphatase n=1 Tax=Agromyces terreus TaxID=424795 RepID=A0A9X2GX46_9MICO|nr:histidine phosphatase family protein [Agromyces terreus]MCP2370695.1 phosphohistidine phosphatase [Agromyces terreus]
MKTLMLVRHAKSDWGEPGLADHDRPLNARGLRDAPEMGRRLRERGVIPDMIVSSTALRARTTARLIAGGLGLDEASVMLDDRLYGSSPATILRVIGELGGENDRVMLVAHNPGVSEFAGDLTGSHRDLPTCAVVGMDFDIDEWAEIEFEPPVDSRFDAPRS